MKSSDREQVHDKNEKKKKKRKKLLELPRINRFLAAVDMIDISWANVSRNVLLRVQLCDSIATTGVEHSLGNSLLFISLLPRYWFLI